MIVIVSDNIPRTIARWRNDVRGISRCRLQGTMNGRSVRIISRKMLFIHLAGMTVEQVIWDFPPTETEKEFASAHTR